METAAPARFAVAIRIANLYDFEESLAGRLAADQVRFIETDAVIDDCVMGLSLPHRFIQQLGLRALPKQPWRHGADGMPADVFSAVCLTIQERDCISDVEAIPDESSATIGRVPLALSDWVIDPIGRRLIGNPEHGGEHMIDVL